jgi:hypothetical protein
MQRHLTCFGCVHHGAIRLAGFLPVVRQRRPQIAIFRVAPFAPFGYCLMQLAPLTESHSRYS